MIILDQDGTGPGNARGASNRMTLAQPGVYGTSLALSWHIVFDLTLNPPEETAILTCSDGTADPFFGYTVATGGGRIAVGAYKEVGASNLGHVCIFEQVGGNWTQTALVGAFEGYASDELPEVAMDNGDLLVVGFSTEGNGGTVTVYEWDETAGYQLLQVLTNPGYQGIGDSFGRSVDIHCSTIIGEHYLFA